MQINKSIFRKYDIRGIYPSQINEKIISKIGDAISLKCNAENINEIFLGRDGRLSGKTLLDELSKSLVKNVPSSRALNFNLFFIDKGDCFPIKLIVKLF